jgi:hypothetical protein
MDDVEQAFIRGCLRYLAMRKRLGSSEQVAKRLAAYDPSIDIDQAARYLYTQAIRPPVLLKLSISALRLIGEDYEAVADFYGRENPDILGFLEKLLPKHGISIRRDRVNLTLGTPSKARNVDLILSNWKRAFSTNYFAFTSGIYQTFRRYKPTQDQMTSHLDPGTYNWADPQNQAVICELIHFNMDEMECTLVTGDSNVYIGSMFLNYEGILFGILQRPSSTTKGGVHQRIFVTKIEPIPLAVFSGLSIKTGDITGRPVSSELLFIKIPRELDEGLYEEFENLSSAGWSAGSVGADSQVAQYLAITPPQEQEHPNWKRVRYLRDFPGLAKMAQQDPRNLTRLFREPSRTLSRELLRTLRFRLPVFVQEPDRWLQTAGPDLSHPSERAD